MQRLYAVYWKEKQRIFQIKMYGPQEQVYVVSKEKAL